MYEHTAPSPEAARLYTETVSNTAAEAVRNGLTLSQHIRATYDALHDMGLAEEARREAVKTQQATAQAQLDAIKAQVKALAHIATAYAASVTRDRSVQSGLLRAEFLDFDLLSGMFAAMTHDEIHNEYGHQTHIGVITGDYANMFDLR